MHICIHLFLSLCVIPSAHSSFNAFMYACMQAFIQSSIHSFQCSFNFVDFFLFQSLIVCSPIIAFHCLVHSWVHPSICPSIHSFNLSFMHSCIHHAFRHLGVSPFSIFLKSYFILVYSFNHLFHSTDVHSLFVVLVVVWMPDSDQIRLQIQPSIESNKKQHDEWHEWLICRITWTMLVLQSCYTAKFQLVSTQSFDFINFPGLTGQLMRHNLIWLWLGWVWCSLPCGIHVHKMTLKHMIFCNSIRPIRQE